MSNISRRQDQGLGKTAAGGSGGSFAAHNRDGAAPPPSSENWGDTGVDVGDRTPWGAADWVTHPAPGITAVSTDSHGGVKLSAERNSEIPAALRQRNGWYEEDCEAQIPMYYFTDEMARDYRSSPDELRANAVSSIKNYYPDGWEKATGEAVSLEDSSVLRERRDAEAAHEQMAVTSARRAESDPDKVLVTARRAVDGRESEYLVDRAEYKAHDSSSGKFIIDPERHAELPPAPEEPKPQNTLVTIPDELPASLTAAARKRIEKDLGQRWQTEGGVKTLKQILETEGAERRSVYVEGDGANVKFSYAVAQADNSSLKVSKATFDYLDQIPDRRTDADFQREDSLRKEAKLEKLVNESRWDRNFARSDEKVRAARRELLESQEAFLALRNLEDAEQVLREGTVAEREERRKAAQAAREKAAGTAKS